MKCSEKENPTWIAKGVEKAEREVGACCVRQSVSAFLFTEKENDKTAM